MVTQQRTRRRSRIGLIAVTLSCLLVGGYGLALVATGFRLLPSAVAANGLPLVVHAHIAASSVALLLLPWQLLPVIRRRWPRIHRWVGRGYAVTAVVGGATGVLAAVGTTGGNLAAAGFTVLGALWMLSTVAAVAAARRRDFADHRIWAVRSFALAFAAVTLRVYLPLALMAGVPYEIAYPIVAVLCWVPNLILAERFLQSRPAASAHVRLDAPSGRRSAVR